MLWRTEKRHPGTFPDCHWETPGEMQFTSSQCWLKSALEHPNSAIFATGYRFIALVAIAAFVVYRNRPRQLKTIAFWLHFMITIVIRCLTTFSGFTIYSNWSSLIWNSNSLIKGLWLWLLVQNGCWACTYLGFYTDFYFIASARTVYNATGDAVWTFKTDDVNIPIEDDHDPYWPMFLPWRDVVVRLTFAPSTIQPAPSFKRSSYRVLLYRLPCALKHHTPTPHGIMTLRNTSSLPHRNDMHGSATELI
ncbi:hypothetical protein CC86DRAFT_75822 [Ophiobolus disseminans]|uniref:Uncharacterized protein n=1 Tax=Ophiobolus disseminans TaxID=1469910 RepID=A0A6A6ZRJ8_9PLEO|nr:hypothetical protein CC86DRAFT_75822 [Ophiobolus disseminans]